MEIDSALTSILRCIVFCAAGGLASCSSEKELPAPTPTPEPVALPPVPTATPTPIPTPTPTYRDSYYHEFRRKLHQQTQEVFTRLGKEAAEAYPRIKIGDTALIRTRGGLQVEGRLQYITDRELMIATSTGSRTFNVEDLDAFTRFRIDGNFRKEIIGYEAAYEAFYALSQQYDLEQFDLGGTLPEAERAKMGQPESLLELAERASEEGRSYQAFHLNRILAAYGHSSAKRHLALLYFQGEAVERDTRQGEALLMDAADQGDEKAIALLAELRKRLEQAANQAQAERESIPKYKTVYVPATCPHCDGKGYRIPGFSSSKAKSKKLPCKCGGTGTVRVPRSVKTN